jgi:hypothetical protein
VCFFDKKIYRLFYNRAALSKKIEKNVLFLVKKYSKNKNVL